MRDRTRDKRVAATPHSAEMHAARDALAFTDVEDSHSPAHVIGSVLDAILDALDRHKSRNQPPPVPSSKPREEKDESNAPAQPQGAAAAAGAPEPDDPEKQDKTNQATWVPVKAPNGKSYLLPEGSTLTGSSNEMALKAPGGGLIVATLSDDGELALAAGAPPSSLVRGSKMMQIVMDYFGGEVKSISGFWRFGDNLATVNSLTEQGMPLRDAISRTWTARQARQYGFGNATILETEGAPGSYTKVHVRFWPSTTK